MNRLGFRPVEVEGSSFLRWMACIDDQALADAVRAFEASKGFDVQGGYGGVPIRISKDSIDASNNDFARMNPVFRPTQGGHVILLECVCGFEGCWPLLAGLTVDDARVVWSDFCQPHRPDRDYTGFGPFSFDLADYVRAIRSVLRDASHHGRVGR